MSEGIENVYGLLDDEDKEEKTDDLENGNNEDEKKNEEKVIKKEIVDEIPKEENGDSSWTDVPSTKTRKTAIPVASLFNKPEGGDRPPRASSSAPVPVAAPPVATTANQSSEAPKKKVLRFTREELLALYRPTKCLPEIEGLAEIATLEALEPECRNPFDHEEVLKIWNAADPTKQKDAGGRGRGRGKGREEDGHYSSHQRDDDNNQDMWDDIDASNTKTFDLADFSAAAFKFSESSIKLSEATSLYSKEGDDTMESLMSEEIEKKQPEESKIGNERGRNLLLQTLSVKPTETKPAPPNLPFKATVVASTDDTLLDELIDEDVVVAPLEPEGSAEIDDSLTFDAADDLDLDSIIGGLTATPFLTETKAPQPQLQVIPPSAVPSIPASFLQQPMQQQLPPAQQPQSQPQLQPMYSLGSQQMPRPQMVSPSRPLPQSHILPMMSQPPMVNLPDKWIYRDPHGNIQGPFEMAAMRRWLESGYFKENLPIKMTRWNTFYPLGVVYPNPETAFLTLIHEPMMQQQPSHMAPQHMMPPQQQHQQQPTMVSSQQSMQQQHHQSTAMQQMQEQRPRAEQRPETNMRQVEESQAQQHSTEEENGLKGKRGVAKQAPVAAPEPEATSTSSAATKESKKSKESQQKEEPMKTKSASSDANVTPVSSESSAKQKDQKKTKSAKKSSNDDSQSNKRDENSSSASAAASSTVSGATPWANKKVREGNESKTLKLTEIQQEEAAKKQHNPDHPNSQTENPPSSVRSFQLKNLLGVGGKEKGWSANSNQSAASLREIQVEQEKLSQVAATQQRRAAENGPPAAPPQPQINLSQWKSPQQIQAARLAEIMEQEKLAAATAGASQQSETKPIRGSWAAKAGGSKAMDGGIPAAWITGQSQRSDGANLDPTPAAAAGRSVKPVVTSASSAQVIKKSSASTPSQPSVPVAPPSSGDSIVDWSVQQLKRFTSDNKSSTDDRALIDFCLTLKSAVEIREYLADYLGSTPQVSQFATEFIRRKEGKQPTQLRSTAGGTALTSASLLVEKDKKVTMPTETVKKKKQRGGKGSES